MSEPGPAWHGCADAAAQISALASRIAGLIEAALAARGAATLIVSGGRSPVPLFQRLAGMPLDWAKVTISLADERWVAPDQPDSNEALLRRHLLQGEAAAARLVGLYTGEPTPEAGEAACAARVAALPRPFAAVVLGMGDDGHTASLFPAADHLASALASDAGPCRAIRAPGAPQPRMTLTLPSLLDADSILLAIQGTAKRAVYEQALAAGPVAALPVRAVLRQRRTPVEVYWAPESLA